MARPFLVLLLLAAPAWALDCREALLQEGLAQLLAPGAVEPLEMTDAILVTHLARKSQELSVGGVQVLARTLARAEPLVLRQPLDDVDSDFLAHVVPSHRRLRFRFRAFLRDHPLGRIVAAHEGAHLVHAVNRWNLPILSARLAWQQILPLEGVLREERWAFGSEWEFVHRAYRLADLPRLRALYPMELPADVGDCLRRFGIFRLEEEGEEKFIAAAASEQLRETTPEVEVALKAYLRARLNEEFLGIVEKALATTRESYLEWAIHDGYRRTQSDADLRRAILFGGVATGVAGIVATLLGAL